QRPPRGTPLDLIEQPVEGFKGAAESEAFGDRRGDSWPPVICGAIAEGAQRGKSARWVPRRGLYCPYFGTDLRFAARRRPRNPSGRVRRGHRRSGSQRSSRPPTGTDARGAGELTPDIIAFVLTLRSSACTGSRITTCCTWSRRSIADYYGSICCCCSR